MKLNNIKHRLISLFSNCHSISLIAIVLPLTYFDAIITRKIGNLLTMIQIILYIYSQLHVENENKNLVLLEHLVMLLTSTLAIIC